MSQSPIGSLMVEAEKKSKGKASGHTAVATCGCEVAVSRFGSGSQRISPSRCAQHALQREAPAAPSKRGRRKVEVEV